MNICPNCNSIVDFEEVSIDITSSWVQLIIKCPKCEAELVRDIQLDHFRFDPPIVTIYEN